jgi:hypothetical protein|tara:strand:+ start:67 stop:279 length:213 start_codon:yes stop_codon:yes gene_type:complete
MKWLKEFWVALTTYERKIEKEEEKKTEPKRARDKGKFVADDKSTPDVNEAWEGGKAPNKKTKRGKPSKKK